jgi:hypothetical protein
MTPDKSEPDAYDEYGGIWDDVQTALKWKPILPLVKALEDAQGTVDKAEAARELSAFAIKNALGTDPYKHRAFLIYCKFVELIKEDPQWRAIVEGILK